MKRLREISVLWRGFQLPTSIPDRRSACFFHSQVTSDSKLLCHHLPSKSGVQQTYCSYTRQLASLIKTTDPFDNSITEVIDVRAPLEYEQDHIPGSINIPVLNNEQRVHVGKLYKNEPFQASKLGASMVTGNISQHISQYFIFKPITYRPLIYSWRGGQRSQCLALVLAHSGFEVRLLEGGYRTYRKQVISNLLELPDRFHYIKLTGLTGTGKTFLLQHLQASGHQVLDLEELASHRGSLLGQWHQRVQPSQKLFESFIREKLASFHPDRPVWLESESSKVGKLHIPLALFKKICGADRIEVFLPMQQRVEHIASEYYHWTENGAGLKSLLLPLRRVRGQAIVDQWFHLIDKGQWSQFVESILIQHYDLSYEVSQQNNHRSGSTATIHLKDLSEESAAHFVKTVTSETFFKQSQNVNQVQQ